MYLLNVNVLIALGNPALVPGGSRACYVIR